VNTHRELIARLTALRCHLRDLIGSDPYVAYLSAECADIVSDLEQTRWVRADHLAGISELAALFFPPDTDHPNVTNNRTTIATWVSNPNAGFPDPVARLAGTPVWDVTDVVDWWLQYVPRTRSKSGRPDPALLEQFRTPEAS
jgi:hypothetical protein